MAKLNLSVAVGDYDRTRALIDGSVGIDGVEAVVMTLSPEEIFFRAFRNAEFDICELSLSSFTVKTAQATALMSACRPSCRARSATPRSTCAPTASSSRGPQGRKVGLPEYQLTANVWARAILEDDYGVKPADIHWIRGGIEEPDGRKRSPSSSPGRSPRQRPGGLDDFADAGRRRDRRIHGAAPADAA